MKPADAVGDVFFANVEELVIWMYESIPQT